MGLGRMKRRRAPQANEEPTDLSDNKASDEDLASRTPLANHHTVSIEVKDAPSLTGRPLQILKCVALVSSVLTVILLAVVIILAYHLGAVSYCLRGFTSSPRVFDNPGVFDDMTPAEYEAVRDYMLHRSGIGLMPFERATVNSSYIYMIDLQMPLKSAVLEYLDRGSVRLKRAAKVVVFRGDLDEPRVEEYLVSPLPRPKTHKLARNPVYTKFPIPFSSRPTSTIEYRHINPIISEFTAQIYEILVDSYGLCHHNCTKNVNCMVFYDVGPRGRKSGDRTSWFWSFRDVEGFYLHPLGLEILIDHVSADVTQWKILQMVYNGQLMYTVDDFLSRYRSNNLRKIRQEHPVGRREDLYSSYIRRGEQLMPEPLQGPKHVEPDGHRYRISGQHVKYMQWDFDVRMRSSTGLQLFDVRFQSERIAYELSLQDAVVFYSGYGPTQSMSNYYDTSWMMGASSFELVRGVDCPDTASFLDAFHFVNNGKPNKVRNSICIFEHDPGLPLRRHYTNDFESGYTFYGGLVDYQLIVRHIINIWNYDYIFDYIFHLNGELEVRVSTTGYVQATYKLPFERPYGNPIFSDVVADIHHHLFHYKVDLDIAGLKNTYSLLDIETETQLHPWYSNTNRTEMLIREKKMLREMDILVADSDNPRYHIIHSGKAENKYGTKRGYRILNRDYSPFILGDADVTNAANWAKYPIVVTQYDDTEYQSSSIFAQNDPWDPIVDFDRFVLDNDTIDNVDLVAWVTLGVHHIPRTEDVPSTPTSSNQFRFHLVPFNYFTECPSVSSSNGVHIRPDARYEDIKVNTFGTSFHSTCSQRSLGPDTFYGYWGNRD